MDYNFGVNNPNNYGVGSNAFNFSSPQNFSSINNWGMQAPATGALSPAMGNGSDSFSWAAPGSNASPGIFGNSGIGMNIPTLQLGFQGLSSLANLYGGIKALGLATDQYNLQKQVAGANLANSTQAYNTNLTDKATARGVTEGQTPGQVQSYITANKLPSTTLGG